MSLTDMIDSHTHLLHIAERGLDIESLLKTWFEAGMLAMIDVGVDLDHGAERTELARNFPRVLRSEGLYPSHADRADFDTLLDELALALGQNRVVAVGEIGIDYHWNYGTPQRQQELFRRQLDLARRRGLPVIIHNREADTDILAAITAAGLPLAGVMHCFSGDIAFARRCLDAGLYISFAGNVTFKNAATLREVARFAPADRILVETDAPYLAPHPMRGSTN